MHWLAIRLPDPIDDRLGFPLPDTVPPEPHFYYAVGTRVKVASQRRRCLLKDQITALRRHIPAASRVPTHIPVALLG